MRLIAYMIRVYGEGFFEQHEKTVSKGDSGKSLSQIVMLLTTNTLAELQRLCQEEQGAALCILLYSFSINPSQIFPVYLDRTFSVSEHVLNLDSIRMTMRKYWLVVSCELSNDAEVNNSLFNLKNYTIRYLIRIIILQNYDTYLDCAFSVV